MRAAPVCHEKVQFPRPVAGRQVRPSSTETPPPPTGAAVVDAVPETVTIVLAGTELFVGDVIAEVGLTVSVVDVVRTSPDWRVNG